MALTLASISLGIASLAGVIIVATPTAASAATTTLSSPTTLTGSQTLSSVGVVATDPVSALSASFDLVTTAAWTQPAAAGSTRQHLLDPNLVRQGRALNPTDSYTRLSPGSMSVSWTLSNLSVSWGSVGPLNLGSPGFSATAPCDLMAGGASTFHVYSTPGDYVATLTVTDQYGASASSSRTVHVTKRDTTTAYSGDTSGTFDTPSTLQASVVDQFGQLVIGRTVSFQVDSDGPFTALTNSSGVAPRSYAPTLASGNYSGSVAFAGDALYNASSSTTSFAVAKKATTTLYTGAVVGAPNKTVALSASLTDATGKPLAGRTVNFQLGTQSASAVTNLLGAATTSLKLTQKNGTYTVPATYDPAGSPPDGSHYLGSGQSASFKLQSK